MKLFVCLLIIFAFINLSLSSVNALEDPLSVPNNKIGVHILFPTELSSAAKLINSNNGDWGYVTIPVQIKDRDLIKWQKFMDEAKKIHVIPIIRIATEGYYFNSSVWEKSADQDILDFANFLNSLDFPTKNKYIVILNEVNRADEWQGEPNPGEYARILSYAVSAFKSVNQDFFIISAGLDNGASNSSSSIDQYNFMTKMDYEVPGIFGQIDGLASHSYPNPGFSVPPWVLNNKSIGSFRYEKNLAEKLGGKKLPIFITETGWSREKLSDEEISSHMQYAFEKVWIDIDIVAVTPFLLRGGPPYSQFSLINEDGSYNKIYLAIEDLPKTKGAPMLGEVREIVVSKANNLPVRVFPKVNQYTDKEANIDKTEVAIIFLKWFFKSLNVL